MFLVYMCVAALAVVAFVQQHVRRDLMMPRTTTMTYGSCSFAVSRQRVWNDLPPTLRSSSTNLDSSRAD